MHGLFLPACISMYACMLAVTNPDTVKRIRSTLRRVALRPTRDVAGACFAARVRAACFALAVIGERKGRFTRLLQKFFCIKKKPPYGGLVYSLKARVSSGHNVAALMRIRLSVSLTAC